MDRMITLSPNDIYTALMAVCGTITATAAAIAVIVKAVQKMKQPNITQDERLDQHENWLKRHDDKFKEYDGYLSSDRRRLDKLESSNVAFSRYMLAIGNFLCGVADKESLQKAIGRFQDFTLTGEDKDD